LAGSRLADDLPQLVEADFNPVVARPDGFTVVDARIRLSSVKRRRRSCAAFR
jgi:hypothetical protein